MWCSTCQQDVPGLGSASGGALRCGKCGTGLTGGGPQTATIEQDQPWIQVATATDNATLEKLLAGSALSNEDWALEAELRGVQRLLASTKARHRDPRDAAALHDLPATLLPPIGAAPIVASDPRPLAANQVEAARRNHAAAWTILVVGLAIFACGAVLLAWSLVGQRDDLWPVGMPLALIGQAGLILGLILQLDSLWHTSRQTATVLSELDGELRSVRQATTLLSTSHSGGAQSFYLHLAEGASPPVLLADLKGQMDLLAQQLARQNSR